METWLHITLGLGRGETDRPIGHNQTDPDLARGGYVTLPPIYQIRCGWARRSGHGGQGCDD